MVGAIISVVVSIGVTVLLSHLVTRWMKDNGFSFHDDGESLAKPKRKRYEGGPVPPIPMAAEYDSSLTPSERAEELRLIEEAWNIDQTKETP